MSAGVIIVAAGSGTRMGRPKQFLPLCGKPVVCWSLEAFLSMPEVERIVVVTTPENIERYGDSLQSDRVRVVAGGATRMASVRNGFAALGEGPDVVAVHDGARPLITVDVVRKTLDAAHEYGASVAAVGAKDTLKVAQGSELWVTDTPDRSTMWQAQTPQSYRRNVLARALDGAPDAQDATDESQLVERMGQRVRIVESSYENIKITTPEDLLIAEAMINERFGTPKAEMRTGFGYDIHRFEEGRPLWLAGLEIPHGKGLKGHSDGDAVLHAVCDAVLGALGEGEIGIAFPPSNPEFKGISSRKIVEHVLDKTAGRGAVIKHIDATIVAEEPKFRPHYEKLRKSLAECFGLPLSRVNLKAKSHEGLGELGRGEALECHAVASVSVPEEPSS